MYFLFFLGSLEGSHCEVWVFYFGSQGDDELPLRPRPPMRPRSHTLLLAVGSLTSVTATVPPNRTQWMLDLTHSGADI